MLEIRVVVFFLLVLSSVLINNECHRNNVCKSYKGYLAMGFSKDCYYSPDIFSDVPQLLKRYVSNYETHTVTTEDGYILTMFRIPKKNPKGVVVLKHQLTTDCMSWLSTSNSSLAFVLSREGYDIWLPNVRGTRYSRKHVNDKITSKNYWDFSFHEQGYYDYPAFFDYIKNATGSFDLICIGHSASSTQSLIYASLRPEHAEKSVKIFIEMSPTALFRNITSPLKYVAPFFKLIKFFLDAIGKYSLLGEPLKPLFQRLLLINPFKKLYVYGFSFTTGWTPNQFNPEWIPSLIADNPSAISTKSVYHYAQLAHNDGEFRMYDYGKKRNKELYTSEKPALYPLERIKVPIYMIYSTSDTITDAKNAERLYEKLPPIAKIYGKLKVSGLNHVDFVIGKDRYPLAFNPAIELVRKISNT